MTENLTWRARLRFRVQKKIRIDANEHRLRIAGCEVVLTPDFDGIAVRRGT